MSMAINICRYIDALYNIHNTGIELLLLKKSENKEKLTRFLDHTQTYTRTRARREFILRYGTMLLATVTSHPP